MRIKKSSSLLLAAAVAVAIAAPSAAGPNREKGEHPSDFTNQEHDHVEVCGSEDDPDYVSIDGTNILWPPNHREVDYLVTAVDVGNNDGEVIVGTTSTHDEIGMNGAGDPSNVDTYDGDMGEKYTDGGDGKVELTVTLLAERSGQGDGREYTVAVDATFDNDTCSFDYIVDVPHDMGVKPQDERGRAVDEDA